MWILLASLAFADPEDGRYESVLSGDEIGAVIDAAIEEGAQQYSFAVRWIVRSRLQGIRDWCTSYDIVRTGDQWSHSCDGKPPTTGTIGADAVSIERKDKSTLTFTLRQADGRDVTAKFMGEEGGGRQQTYKFKGDHLLLDVMVISDQLDPPVAWTLRYDLKK